MLQREITSINYIPVVMLYSLPTSDQLLQCIWSAVQLLYADQEFWSWDQFSKEFWSQDQFSMEFWYRDQFSMEFWSRNQFFMEFWSRDQFSTEFWSQYHPWNFGPGDQSFMNYCSWTKTPWEDQKSMKKLVLGTNFPLTGYPFG